MDEIKKRGFRHGSSATEQKSAQRITRSQLIKLIQDAQKGKNSKYRKIALGVLVVLLIFFIYNYINTRNELNRLSNPTKVADQQASDLSKEVGKYLELPSDETPTVATVKDVSKLKDNEFFKDAKEGDKVLIYKKTGKAVLYRPNTKKIIIYAPVADTTPSQQ